MKDEKTILICESHKEDYPTPLITAMAFRHCELWCPYCGEAFGMFEGGAEMKWTQELQDRHDKYKKKYSEYLHASGMTYASGVEYQGKNIHPRDLPQEEKDRLKSIRQNDWKEGIRIEEQLTSEATT